MGYLLKRLEFEQVKKTIDKNIKKYLDETDLKSWFDNIYIDVFNGTAKFYVASVYQNTSIIVIDLNSGKLSIEGSDRLISVARIKQAIEIVTKLIWEEE
jgi:hypothetical protein